MTVIDHSIPYEPLLMLYQSQKPGEVPAVPNGFHLAEDPCLYKDQWAALMYSLGFFGSSSEAETYFSAMMAEDPQLFASHFWMLLDEHNHLAGSIGLWPGNHLGIREMRIHFVGIDEIYQKRHLGAFLVRYAIARYFEQYDGQLYLSTQAQSWPAILLYKKCGFVPAEKTEKDQAAWQKAASLVYEKEKIKLY